MSAYVWLAAAVNRIFPLRYAPASVQALGGDMVTGFGATAWSLVPALYHNVQGETRRGNRE